MIRAAALALALGSAVSAEELTSASYRFAPNVTDSGGGTSSSAGTTFLHAIGEPVTETQTAAASGTRFSAGFINLLRTTPKEALEDLLALVKALGLQPPGLSNSLVSKLEAALKAIESGSKNTASNQLDAFENEVRAQRGKALTAELADSLLSLEAFAQALLQAPAPGGAKLASAGEAFRLGEHYCFPNPAKQVDPTFHVEAGQADQVTLNVYDLSGALRHQAELGPPQTQDGRLAYEAKWSGAASGVYVYAFTARKAGAGDLKAIGKCAVVR